MPELSDAYFLGEFPGLIDDKARISVPADFRNLVLRDFDGKIVLALGSEGDFRFINAFPLSFYNAVYAAARARTVTSFLDDGSMAADFYSSAKAIPRTLDTQGRITIPQFLVAGAGISREIVFMGRWNHFVIWPADQYEAFGKSVPTNPGSAWKHIAAQGKAQS